MTPAPGEPRGRRPARDPLRVVAGPLIAYFDKRFQDVYDRIDDRMNGLYARVATEVETMSEMTLVMQRFVDLAGQQVDDMLGRMSMLCDRLDREGVAAIESAFAMAAVGRLRRGARILHVAGSGGDAGLPATLRLLGYEVSTADADAAAPFDCVLWLPGHLDQHEVDLLGKSLEPGGELVLSLRHAGAPPFAGLGDWSVVEHRTVTGAGGAGSTVVELVRATPRP